ncbi:SGNH/GDSL hydrolase family protein [Streptomyces sp. NBC_00572]|uniref:SGNH/GDSL hydrolase family protein n=1 Tax=Streptomyces sp. NBC_00572 TaxID=2903664 RepID=UPI0022521901|nr:GDSL-type esterase/lipase family protein [Streptomyces sp. NBC_00572]MCX4987078.1 GDSL-type esterase/lipase family protein [Streptomyces sp. NBC_00572]
MPEATRPPSTRYAPNPYEAAAPGTSSHTTTPGISPHTTTPGIGPSATPPGLGPHPAAPGISSYAALGDSFTEGIGDETPGGEVVGWADRLATRLARHSPTPEFRYANLAVRGRLLDEIVEEQVPRVREFAPDLVSLCAGGNDILHPGSSPDDIAARFEAAVTELTGAAGTVLVFTGFDPRDTPVLRRLRGKIAVYTAHIRAIADRHGCAVVDLWSLRAIQHPRAWSEDRLHLSSQGHEQVARRAADVLGLPRQQEPASAWAAERRPWPAEQLQDLRWFRAHFLPWMARQLRGQSAGDGMRPKRPDLSPLGKATAP